MLCSRSKSIVSTFALGIVLTTIGACSMNKMDGFSNEDWQRVTAIVPLATEMPANPFDTRGTDDAVAKFGQRLFFDKRGAEAILVDGPSGKAAYTPIDPTTGTAVIDPVTMMPKVIPGDKGKISCWTCHGSTYFVDTRTAYPISHGRTWLAHNTPTMVNLGYFQPVLWTGRFDSLREHGTGAMGGAATVLAQIHFIYQYHLAEYNQLFPDTPLDPALDPTAMDAARFPATGAPKGAAVVNGKTVMGPDGVFEKMTKDDQWAVHQFRGNMGIVFEAHPRKLTTPGSAFERYVRTEDTTVMSEQAKSGLKLFIGKASCIDCHNGPALTDNQFHNIGVKAQAISPPGTTTAAAVDHGREGVLFAALNNQLMNLRTNDMLGMQDQVAIMGGAGQFSDDPVAGRKRLQDQEDTLCMQRSTDVADVTAACQALFFGGTPEDDTKTPPVAAKPADMRLQVCIDANAATGACMLYDPSFEGAFRTPMLLNVAETAPYFHTGEYATLRDVVNHYNQGGGLPGTFPGTKSPRLRPLGLSDTEVDDLVEFLKTLTGNPPDPNWTCDPSLPPAAAGQPSVAGGACAAS